MLSNISHHHKNSHAFSFRIFSGLLTVLLFKLLLGIAYAGNSLKIDTEGTPFSRDTVIEYARQLAEEPFK